MTSVEELRDHLLTECKEDEVGLWYIVKNVRESLGVDDPVEARQLTLRLVRELLGSGSVVAGYYALPSSGIRPGSIVPWMMPIDTILARIEEEWDRLGREPNIAEIVIFVAWDSWRVWYPERTDRAPHDRHCQDQGPHE